MGDGEDDHRSKINVASPTRTRSSKLSNVYLIEVEDEDELAEWLARHHED